MKYLHLSFNGPFPFNDTEIENIQLDIDKAGVYIWGFSHPINKRFIPYNVGAVGLSLRAHLIRQYKILFDASADNCKWLSEDYLFGLNDVAPFYSDIKFPDFNESRLFEGIQHPPVWYQLHRSYFDDKFIYLNNFDFLRKKIPGLTMSASYPISILGSEIEKTVPYIDRLQYYFAKAENILNHKLFYEYLQASARYLLKGKTTGYSLNFGDLFYLQKNGLPLVTASINKGFSESITELFKDQPGLDFPGY